MLSTSINNLTSLSSAPNRCAIRCYWNLEQFPIVFLSPC